MIKINNTPLTAQYFPDGTLRLNIVPQGPEVALEWLFENNEETLTLFFAVQHLRAHGTQKFTLHLPYIPNARMDRVKNADEVFTLKYFAQFINSLGFEKVLVRDAHSDVSLALLDRVERENIQPKIAALAEKLLTKKDVIFFPDAGSCKRYKEYTDRPTVYGVKERDWKTGKILGLKVEGQLPTAPFNVLIIDDISSYGGTFYHSAKKLKELGAEKIWLYVTHCENSILDGELIKSGLVERIYTTQSIYTKQHDLIEII